MKFRKAAPTPIWTSSVLIDTNVWSELTKRRPAANVLRWMAAHFSECRLSAIVLAEMRYGIALAADEPRRRELQSFHDDLLAKLHRPIAPFDDNAAAAWGPLRALLQRTGKFIAERDMLIAAHAISLEVPLVTRNVSDMARTGAVIIDPWQA